MTRKQQQTAAEQAQANRIVLATLREHGQLSMREMVQRMPGWDNQWGRLSMTLVALVATGLVRNTGTQPARYEVV
jgi:hypothetical protein